MNASCSHCPATMLPSPLPQPAFACTCSPNCASSSAQARTLKSTVLQGRVNEHRRPTLHTLHYGALVSRKQSVPKQIRILAAGDMHQTSVDSPDKIAASVAEIESKGFDTSGSRGRHASSWQNWGKVGYKTVAIAAGIMLGAHVWAIPSSYATDALKTCACLLKECRVELARCIGNPACAANVACLQTCNNRADETECQIGCGDLFENSAVDQFNDCAVSRKKCVPQKSDQGDFPVPPPTALANNFNLSGFDGKWYISSGLNPTFDTFDCQLHEFTTSPNKLTGKLSWRIKTPDGGFFTRSAGQNFNQDPSQPAVLYNHNNDFLHYQDDWYILSAKTERQPDDYVFVYYRGRNDAWDGYGGAVVYTRSKTLPTSILSELSAAAIRAGLDFKKFRITDNTCGPEPPLFARIEKEFEAGEQAFAQEVKQIEEEVGRDEMTFLDKLKKGFQEFTRGQDSFFRELGDEEKAVLRDLQMEADEVEKLFGKPLPIRKLR